MRHDASTHKLECPYRNRNGLLVMRRELYLGLMIGAVGASAAALVIFMSFSVTPAPVASPPIAMKAAKSERFSPPSLAEAPADAWGDAIRHGEKLMTNTATLAPQYVGNGLVCSNCHLDAGRKAGAAPMWGAFVTFPAFRAKNGEINSFQKRVQDCFLYSLNGTPPPLGSPELLAIESYAAFMAKGLPSGISPTGRGFPKIAAPPQPTNDERGAIVFAEQCSACHGPEGQGQTTDDGIVYPPLWGAKSYNWGAGMARTDKAAAFIHANMPLGQEGSLTVQQAWDVAFFIDGKDRPQDPRFSGDLQATRNLHHDTPLSRYGTVVSGRLLGTPNSGSKARPATR